MQSALTVFWILSGLGFAIGVVITIVGLVRAPEGFEDEAGFHPAAPDSSAQTAMAPASHAVRPRQAEAA